MHTMLVYPLHKYSEVRQAEEKRKAPGINPSFAAAYLHRETLGLREILGNYLFHPGLVRVLSRSFRCTHVIITRDDLSRPGPGFRNRHPPNSCSFALTKHADKSAV